MGNEAAVKKLPTRSEIKVEDTWRLEDIFPTDDAWEKEFQDVKELVPGVTAYQGKLADSANVLYEALQKQDQLLERISKLYTYAHMRYDQDTTNSFYQGLDARIKALYSQVASALAYIVPEILSIDEEKVKAFLNEKEELKLYEHALEEINLQRPHVLTAEQEALLAEASEVMNASSNTFGMLNNADLEFPSIPLGEDYLNVLKEGFDNRWVDVHENKGKRSGAYSSGTYGTNPYILMNWQDNVNNLFTLAHEFGHSVHSYYTRKTQPFAYGDYSIFVAEVASTCNEALLNDYMLKTIDDEKKRLYLLNHYLEGFRGTVFRQTMFAEFEHLIHQKAQNNEALTAELFTKEYYDLNVKYFGKENMSIDEEIGLEWARIPHFYYNYYVYQYATGFSAATALSKQILEEGQPAVDRYLEFLKSGSSDYPIEVLKKAGVDMTSSTPIEEACKVFEEKLNEMESLLS